MMEYLDATKEEAEAQGYTVDTHTYPWTAYKGPRFDPDERRLLRTPEWTGGKMR